MPKGQCHCGAVQYEMSGEPVHQALCHCSDCRRHVGRADGRLGAGARMMSSRLKARPRPMRRRKTGGGTSAGKCGTALFYTNDVIFPGQTDVQIATLDDPRCDRSAGADPGGRADRLDGKAHRPARVRALSGLSAGARQRNRRQMPISFRQLFPISPLSTGFLIYFRLCATRGAVHCHQVIGTAVAASTGRPSGKMERQ